MFRVLLLITLITISLPLVISNHQNATEKVEKRKVSVNTSWTDDQALRIVNGQPATQGQFPFMVSIKHPMGRKGEIRLFLSVCGGSLIAENKILSAAHCFTRKGNVCQDMCRKAQIANLERYYGVADNLDNVVEEGTKGQWRKLKRAAIPRRYWFPRNDIAIVYTQEPFTIDANVKPIPISSRYKDYGSITCKAIGHGRTNYKDLLSYGRSLLWANLELIPAHNCSRIHQHNMLHFICTSSLGSDILEGDSGGPLVCQNTGDQNENSDGVLVGIPAAAEA